MSPHRYWFNQGKDHLNQSDFEEGKQGRPFDNYFRNQVLIHCELVLTGNAQASSKIVPMYHTGTASIFTSLSKVTHRRKERYLSLLATPSDSASGKEELRRKTSAPKTTGGHDVSSVGLTTASQRKPLLILQTVQAALTGRRAESVPISGWMETKTAFGLLTSSEDVGDASKGENHIGKKKLGTPDFYSNPNLSIIGIPDHYEMDTSDHSATDADHRRIKLLFSPQGFVVFDKKIRDLPQYGHKQWQAYFGRTFDIYTKLWKFQQQHRAVLRNLIWEALDKMMSRSKVSSQKSWQLDHWTCSLVFNTGLKSDDADEHMEKSRAVGRAPYNPMP
uniref:Uncharacterized protein n=1 Tax=Timema poppense TaxID=170557 RepID=A0A7R9GTI2_TIMPO|nr:unnamed protein product [Timema poppensis]